MFTCTPTQYVNFPCWCRDWFCSQTSNCFLPPPHKHQALLAGAATASSLSLFHLASPCTILCSTPAELATLPGLWIFALLETLPLSETPLTWHTETRESSNFIQAGGIVLARIGMALIDIHFTARSCVALQALTVERAFCVYTFPSMFTRIAVCCKKNKYVCVSKPLLGAGKPQNSLLVMVFSSGCAFLASNTGERLFILLGKGYHDWRQHVAVTCLPEAKRKIAVTSNGPKEQLWSLLLITVLKRRASNSRN